MFLTPTVTREPVLNITPMNSCSFSNLEVPKKMQVSTVVYSNTEANICVTMPEAYVLWRKHSAFTTDSVHRNMIHETGNTILNTFIWKFHNNLLDPTFKDSIALE